MQNINAYSGNKQKIMLRYCAHVANYTYCYAPFTQITKKEEEEKSYQDKSFQSAGEDEEKGEEKMLY